MSILSHHDEFEDLYKKECEHCCGGDNPKWTWDEIPFDMGIFGKAQITLAITNRGAEIQLEGTGAEEFGGKISYASRLMHGKSSNISLDYDFIFKGLPSEINVGRYHSLSLVEDSLPECLDIISKAKDDGEVMAVKHKDYEVYGLQFHPESILTPDGRQMIKNFIA